jgi:flagellar hook-length control protein FliK
MIIPTHISDAPPLKGPKAALAGADPAPDAAAAAIPGFAQILEAALDPAGDGAEEPTTKAAAKASERHGEAPEAPQAIGLASPILPAPLETKPRSESSSAPVLSAAAPSPKPDPRAHPEEPAKAEPRSLPVLQSATQAAQPPKNEDAGAAIEAPLRTSPPDEHVAVAHAGPHRPAQGPHAAAPLHVAVPVGVPGFGEAFSARVSLAVRSGAESASIALNPPELGPVEVRIRVADGEAHVAFAAEQPLAREAIAEALPRLREMLSAHGLALADASVGAELPKREPGRASDSGVASESAPAREIPETELPGPHREPRLVDTFA